MTDPFDTAATRTRVLDSWVTAAVRFREDANLEEDLVLGAYRDRLLVELAQNAADAATRAGKRGRLRFTLRDDPATGFVLTAANTGAPLDAAGVLALSTLRASAKRDEWEQAGTSLTATPAMSAMSTMPTTSSASAVPTSSAYAALPVGRFGVGFAAVLAVSDDPALFSRHGSVRFSAAEARAVVQDASTRSAELGAELNRRQGRVPVLRLPFPADGRPPQGYDSVVVLPLRDSAAENLVRGLLAELDDALLLSLPQLAEVVVEVDHSVRILTSEWDEAEALWTVADGAHANRWRLARAHGTLDPLLLANRPVEERAHARWTVTWAVPIGRDRMPRRPHTVPVVHAPTPTDEPLGLPALLIASLPLDPTRRHVAPGPLRDFMLDQAADAYSRLIEQWPAREPGLLSLMPGPLAEGPLDAELRARIMNALKRTAFLPAAAGVPTDHGTTAAATATGFRALRPAEATVLVPCDEMLVAALADTLPGLLPAGWDTEPVALTALGVRRLELAELVDTLGALRRAPSWWARLYTALDAVAGFDPGVREALATIPVPLADGRTVRGAVGVLLPDGDLDDKRLAALRPLRLRLADPAALVGGPGPAALLERLGARPARPRAVLADPALFAAIAMGGDGFADDEPQFDGLPADEDDPRSGGAPGPRPLGARADALAEAVLTLIEAADPGPAEYFGLGNLLLPDDRGDRVPARDLLLPGSPLDRIVRPGALGRVDQDWVRRWGPGPLRAAGVLHALTVLRVTDVLLDPDAVDGELLELDGFEDWLDDTRGLLPVAALDSPPVAAEILAVRDLDLIDPDRWPAALAQLAGPGLRPAVTATMKVLTGDGGTISMPSYSSWWLSRHPVLGGHCPADLVVEGGLLTGLYDQATDVDVTAPNGEAYDAGFLAGLGVRSNLSTLLAELGGPDELLDRLADPSRTVTPGQVIALYRALADVPEERIAPPGVLRALVDGEPAVAEAAQVVVVDAPDLQPLLVGRPVLPVPASVAARLADLLDIDLASELIPGRVTSIGERQPVPETVLDLVPEAPISYFEHEELIVDESVEVTWRVIEGEAHASTVDGLARALAWAAGRWDRRHLIAALLAEPERVEDLAAEEYYD